MNTPDSLHTNQIFMSRILTAILILFVIVAQHGCANIAGRVKAAAKSGKIGEEKGILLSEDKQIIKDFPVTSLSLSLEEGSDKQIHATVVANKKQFVKFDRAYEKVVQYEKYEMESPPSLDKDVMTNIFSFGKPTLLAVIKKSKMVSEESKVEGKIHEKETIVVDAVEHPVGASIDFVCGPAGHIKLHTDKEGKAVLNLKPLLNRLVKDFLWTLTATARYRGFTATESLTLNTTELGITWEEPRYQPDFPPKLLVKAEFKDSNNNQMLDARETANLIITLKNIGRGDAFQVAINPELTGKVEGVKFTSTQSIHLENLAPGQQESISFKLKAEEEVPAQRFRVRVSFKELNGFEPSPLLVNLGTRPYAPPRLNLARWALDDDNEGMSTGNGNKRLEHGEQAELTFFVQNRGAGAAEGVNVVLNVTDIDLHAKKLTSQIDEIPPGEWRKAVFIFRVNNRYKGTEKLPVKIEIWERRPKFTIFQNLSILLGKELPKEKEVLLATPNYPDLVPIPLALPKIDRKESIRSDNLSGGTNYAILIGINNYIDADVRALRYAENDIYALYSVLLDPKIGRYNKNNIFLMTPDAARPVDRPTKLNILQSLKWFSENLKPEDSLFFAFCGHGETDKEINYLIPLDGRLSLPQDTSIRLGRLFEWLDACPANQQIVMLDACHSGGSSKNIRGDRGINIVSKAFYNELNEIGTPEGRAILSSCSKSEISYEDPQFAHGVFSYYLIKGLNKLSADKNNDGKVTIYELGNFAQTHVKSWSKRHRKIPSQTPRLIYNDTSGEIVIASKGVEPESVQNVKQSDNDQYLKLISNAPWQFSDLNTRYIRVEELRGLSSDELWRAKNELLARHGYIFKTPRGKSFAKSLGTHYKGTVLDVSIIYEQFNEYENANFDMIQKQEKKSNLFHKYINKQ